MASSGPYGDDVDVVYAGSYVSTCGVISCSYYFSRKNSRAAAEYVDRHENAINVGVGVATTGACTALGAATGAAAATAGTAIGVCITALNAGGAVMVDQIKAAGDDGQCLKLKYYFYPVLLPATPSADTSGYCQSG